MMNVVNICVALSIDKEESQKSFEDSVIELVKIVKAHPEWIGSAIVLVNDHRNGKTEEKTVFQAVYDYNEETEDEEFTTWYNDEFMEKLGLNKVNIN